MPRPKELKRLIREAQQTDCDRGTCGHTLQAEHCPNHDASMWCQDCIAKPPLVSVMLPDGTVSHGYVI